MSSLTSFFDKRGKNEKVSKMASLFSEDNNKKFEKL